MLILPSVMGINIFQLVSLSSREFKPSVGLMTLGLLMVFLSTSRPVSRVVPAPDTASPPPLRLFQFKIHAPSYHSMLWSVNQKELCSSPLTEQTFDTIYHFTFTLPRIVIDFFLNNQPDALIIQIYSLIKLYMFRASSLPIIRSSLLYIRHW
jgi:hypothetical protein